MQSPFKPAEIPPPTCMESQQQTQGSYLSLGSSTLRPKYHQRPCVVFPPIWHTGQQKDTASESRDARHRSKSHRLVTSSPASKRRLQSCLRRDAPNHLPRPCVTPQKRYSRTFPCCKPNSVISTDNCETPLANEKTEKFIQASNSAKNEVSSK